MTRMADLVSNQMKQGIEVVEYTSPREHYLETSNTHDFYTPDVNNEAQWKTLYDVILEGVNGPSLPLVKVYSVSMFTAGTDMDGYATVEFQLLGRLRTIHIDISTNLPQYKSPVGSDAWTTVNQSWTVTVR